MGGAIIILIRGMHDQHRALTVISSWWGVCDACLAVGIPVSKILLLDIWACTVATLLW